MRAVPQTVTLRHSQAALSQAALSQTHMSQTYQARIYVTLRPSVLDPAGTAVQAGLKQMGHSDIQQVRVGKYIELTLSANSEAAAETQLDQICNQLLANPVIENYRFELTLSPVQQSSAV